MWFHIVVCVGALAFAWTSAHRVAEKTGGPSSVTLLDVEEGDVTRLTYTWEKGQTITTVVGAGKARSAEVKVDRELPPPPKPKDKDKDKDAKDKDAKDGADDATPPEALVEPPARESGLVPGGKGVMSAVAALEPLKTKRSLGSVDGDRLVAMGLSAPSRTLEIVAKGKTLTLEVGEASYGAQGRYARVRGSTEVHLIDSGIVSGLEGGIDALLEKRMVTTELEDIKGFSVAHGERSGAFVHVDRDQASKRFVASVDAPTVKKDGAGKLLTTLRNLRATKLAAADVVAGAVVITVDVDVEGGKKRIELLERGEGAGEGHLLRSGAYTYEASLTQARELMDDVDAAVSE
jgi:hypothetical protein